MDTMRLAALCLYSVLKLLPHYIKLMYMLPAEYNIRAL